MVDVLELTKKDILLQTMEIESGRKLIGLPISPHDTDGGYTDDPNDTGGKTNWGWTEATLLSIGVATPPKDLTFEVAYRLYEMHQWKKVGGDAIFKHHPYLARIIFNYGVHAGWCAAVRRLQMILNLHNNQGKLWADIKEDGYWGKNTQAMLHAYLSKREHLDGHDVIFMDYLIAAGAHYQSLAKANDRYERYYFGWMRRIHEDMERYFTQGH